MGLVARELYQFGGVDSRSNPLNLPSDRCLRCLNWIITEAGNLQLRYGYAVTNQNAAAANRIVNFANYKTLDGTRRVVFFDGATAKTMLLSSGAVSAPTVKGTAFASSAKGTFVFVNNRLQFANGTDMKWFDGTNWRNIGVRPPTAGEAAAVTTVLAGTAAPGVAASSVGGSQPGYQFWMAYYNPTTGDVGNALKIGSRLVPTSAKDITISSLPDLSGVDTELVKLIFRTGDGGEVAYACADTSGNWYTVANATTSGTMTFAGIDGNAEAPQRNDLPPTFQRMCLAGDFIFGNPANSATIYKSGFFALKRSGTFVGNPENCFASNDTETFPTNQALSGFFEENNDLWCFSLTAMAILVSDITTGVGGWQGPWNIGLAGDRASCKTDYGRFWVSGDKQLCTMGPNGPISVSGEYERALLSKIGDANLSVVETKYLKDVSKDIDHIDINCLDSNGTPFHVIHDFKLKDSRSPLGQAYERSYQSLLSTTHSIEQIRDNSDRMRIWAGASDGKLYELNSGDNDNGSEYSADLITIMNAGKKRPKLAYIAWNGDGNAAVSIGATLKTTTSTGDDFSFEAIETETMPGGEDDYFYRAQIDKEMRNLFARFQLASHSSTGTLALNTIPHVPVENYGRIYAALALVGEERGTP
jgi:hypothetical protein